MAEWIRVRREQVKEDKMVPGLPVLLVGVTSLALVGVPSRRLVIQKTVFGVPDPNPLPYLPEVITNIKMTDVLEFKNLSNEDLKKRLASQIDIEDWTDKRG